MLPTRILKASALAVLLAAGAQAQTASQICPVSITQACLRDVARHVIAAEPDAGQQARIAQRLYTVAGGHFPDLAPELANAHAAQMSDRDMRRLAKQLQAAGQTEAARLWFTRAAEARAADPNPRTKVLDLLFTGGDMAKAGFYDLTRETHRLATLFLPGALDGFVPMAEELRLARLMALYGWPEDAAPWFADAYDRAQTLPAGAMDTGFTITRFLLVALILGDTDLVARIEADLARFYTLADARSVQQVQGSEITAYAEGGDIARARALSQRYQIPLAEQFPQMAGLFLDAEIEYTPGLWDSTRARFDAMVSAVETEAARGDMLVKLANKLIYIKDYSRIEALLPRVTEPAARSKMVLAMMTFYAREMDAPDKAADLYFAEFPDVMPADRFAVLGTFLQSYPLSLTAQGLWQSGDTARAEILSDIVLALWRQDASGRRSVDSLLISAMAEAGASAQIDDWRAFAQSPEEHQDILRSAARGELRAGRIDGAKTYLADAETALADLSDVAEAAPSWWPADQPFPSERAKARHAIEDVMSDIARAQAEQGDVADARATLTQLGPSDPNDTWHVRLIIAKAEAQAGNSAAADALRYEALDQLLTGEIEGALMPHLLTRLLDDG